MTQKLNDYNNLRVAGKYTQKEIDEAKARLSEKRNSK